MTQADTSPKLYHSFYWGFVIFSIIKSLRFSIRIMAWIKWATSELNKDRVRMLKHKEFHQRSSISFLSSLPTRRNSIPAGPCPSSDRHSAALAPSLSKKKSFPGPAAQKINFSNKIPVLCLNHQLIFWHREASSLSCSNVAQSRFKPAWKTENLSSLKS